MANENKTENIQIRVDSELKKAFYEKAQQEGYSPSELMRDLMGKVVSGRIDIGAERDAIVQTLISIMQVVFKGAVANKDPLMWETLMSNSFLNYYDEMVNDHAHHVSKGDSEIYDRVTQRLEYTDLGLEDFLKEGSVGRLFWPPSQDSMDNFRKSVLNTRSGEHHE